MLPSPPPLSQIDPQAKHTHPRRIQTPALIARVCTGGVVRGGWESLPQKLELVFVLQFSFDVFRNPVSHEMLETHHAEHGRSAADVPLSSQPREHVSKRMFVV